MGGVKSSQEFHRKAPELVQFSQGGGKALDTSVASSWRKQPWNKEQSANTFRKVWKLKHVCIKSSGLGDQTKALEKISHFCGRSPGGKSTTPLATSEASVSFTLRCSCRCKRDRRNTELLTMFAAIQGIKVLLLQGLQGCIARYGSN